MPDAPETGSASVGGIRNGSSNNGSISRAGGGGDRLKALGQEATGATPTAVAATPTAVAATPSPQRPRHHFTRSLSELSSPLRLRRQSQSQSQSPASGHGQSPSLGQNQSQSQGRRTNTTRDNQNSRGGGGGQHSQTIASSSTGTTTSGNAAMSSSTTIKPASPAQSPRLNPLGKSRTVGSMNGSLASATMLTGNFSLPPHQSDATPYGSISSNRTGASSAKASPNTSRRPSVHTGKDGYNPEEYRLQQAQTHQDSHHHNSHDHDHDHDHSRSRSHRHRHRHHHHSLSASSNVGYMSGHSTTLAALAAAATAVAAASPTTPAATHPYTLTHAQTNTAGGFQGPEADRSQDELLQQQQQQERQASTASGAGLPIDPAAVRAAALALERMQREQSRNAARVLQAAAADLDNLSSSTSQRLDAAYGSVLSRLSALQDTVLALRSLASAARATNRRFTSEAEAIAHEIDQQVKQLEVQDHASSGDGSNTANNKETGVVLTPADQQYRLEQLSARVHRGRQSIQDLAERVETARSKVERWERADRAWQERTRTRLKALWVVVSSVVLVLVVLLAVMLRSPGGDTAVSGGTDGGTDGTDGTGIMTASKPSFPPAFSEIAPAPASSGKFHLPFPNGTTHSASNGDGTAGSGQEDDPLHRLFDEL
ncbi:hypothetical protein SCUCBS95973_004997 [Sporothrix curviconia]|uniref:Uncharacterized protein n=1 Tax=Sporothrix curviconia TaxID=1260050 RepID=A0ABP0BTB9_9PEZI